LEEIIAFEEKVKINSGNIQVHSGLFRLTKRNKTNNYGGGIIYDRDKIWSYSITWDCCRSVGVHMAPQTYCSKNAITRWAEQDEEQENNQKRPLIYSERQKNKPRFCRVCEDRRFSSKRHHRCECCALFI